MNASLQSAIREVAAHVVFQCRPRLAECCLTLFGGAAMEVLGVRKTNDVDIHISHPLYPDHQVMRLQGAPDHLEADMTSSRYLFGEWLFEDLGQHGEPQETFTLDGTVFTVRSLSVESLMLQKMHTGRDKDLADVAALAHLTTPERLVQRLAEILPWQDRSQHRYLAGATLSEISLLYWLDEPDYQPKMSAMIATLPDLGLQRALSRSFGLTDPYARQAASTPTLQ